MKERTLHPAFFLLIASLLTPAGAGAATLYQWVDKSGQTHFGYRPPPGVVGAVVADRILQQQRETGAAPNCRQLEQENLKLIDQEIARVKSLSAGFGPSYEFTPEAKQRFINDLMVHRSAFVTGRPPEEFALPDSKREIRDLNQKHQQETDRLLKQLQTQSQQLQQKAIEREQQRQEDE